MPTPSEQKALAFVAIVILLGGAVRVLRAGATQQPTPTEQQGIAHQARAADSAAAAQAAKTKARGRGGRKPRAADTIPQVIGGVSSVPPSFARPDQPFAKSPYGYPPPGPRIDINRFATAPAAAASPDSPNRQKIDLDRASAEEIEKLPHIGPALARRLVANRDSSGPFKNVEGLRRVKGMGPATIKHIAELIIFSGAGR